MSNEQIEQPKVPETDEQKAERQRRQNVLTIELKERKEAFPFPGIDPEAYARTIAFEQEGYGGYNTPIDQLIEKMLAQGIKVVSGSDPDNKIVFVLPFNSDDIGEDGIFPRILATTEDMDPRLKELIEVNRIR